MDKQEFPEKGSVKTWEQDDLTFSIVRYKDGGHFCGYVRFPSRPVKETGYDGILRYIPVHGGLTYVSAGAGDTVVYGFDCNHLDDEKNPLLCDVEWLTAECERMGTLIKLAAEYEARYLETDDNDERGTLIDELRARGFELGADNAMSFGVMISLLGGKL